MLNKEFDIKSLALQKLLSDIAKEVIPTLPFYFGTFEKATYTLKPFSIRKKELSYKFVTTVHNTEEAVEIMKNIFEQKYGYYKPGSRNRIKYYAIIKSVNGIDKIVYETTRYRP